MYSVSSTSSRRLTIFDGLQRVLDELRRMGIDSNDVIISTNVRTRLDGMPRSGEREPDDPGTAVYWRTRDRDQVIAIDLYDRVADNLAAIAATLEAMRAIERHGGAQILERAFTGFVALPQASNWRTALDLPPDVRNLNVVEDKYRRLVSAAHPDRGGSTDRMVELNLAIEAARKELGASA